MTITTNPQPPPGSHYAFALGFFFLLESYLVASIGLKLRLSSGSPDGGNFLVVDWLLFLGLSALFARFILGPGIGDVFFDHAIACNATTTLFTGFRFLIATPRPEVPGSPNVGGWFAKAYAVRMAPRFGLPLRGKKVQRWTFVKEQTLFFLTCLWTMDVLNTIACEIPFFLPTTVKSTGWLQINGRDIRHTPLSFIYAALTYAGLHQTYLMYAISSVALGYSNPEDWPALFGTLEHAWTVQGVWNKFWHQLLRNALTSNSTYILRLLPIPSFLKDSRNRRKCLRFTMVFILSGLLHLAGEYHALSSDPDFSRSPLRGSFTTFAIQPFAIAIEHLVTLLRRTVLRRELGPNERVLAKGVGYIWVVLWFSFSFSFYTTSLMSGEFMMAPCNTPRGVTLGVLKSVVGGDRVGLWLQRLPAFMKAQTVVRGS